MKLKTLHQMQSHYDRWLSNHSQIHEFETIQVLEAGGIGFPPEGGWGEHPEERERQLDRGRAGACPENQAAMQVPVHDPEEQGRRGGAQLHLRLRGLGGGSAAVQAALHRGQDENLRILRLLQE